MGAEISALLIEPVIGAGAVALAIFAIVEENKDKKDSKHDTNAKWLTIASIVVVALLIIINIAITILAG